MQSVFLERTGLPDHTEGIITLENGRELFCLERPWRNNRPFDSCIPDGVYLMEPYDSPKFGQVYIISGGTVSKFPSEHHQRYGILFHPANKVIELQGCVAPGTKMHANGTISNSGLGCKLLFEGLNWEPAMLFISGLDEVG